MKKIIISIFISLLLMVISSCKKIEEKVEKKEEVKIKKFGLVIHGGAGSISKGKYTAEQESLYVLKLNEALQSGYTILENGGNCLDAVESVIKLLEDSPLFNAGKGAVFTDSGINELDASIMSGKDLKAGAVAGLRHIKNPISLARKVMENSPHVLMISDGAEMFAKEMGFEFVSNSYFKTEKSWNEYLKTKSKKNENNSHLLFNGKEDYKLGTVGCVALDKDGNLAAGTSTGGMMMKKYGRVGDVPVIGAGTYANNNTCAVSATGHGEYFIRNVVSYDISALMDYKGMSLHDAAHFVINKKLKDQKGRGGVIAIDKDGNITMSFNTEGMFRGYKMSDKTSEALLY